MARSADGNPKTGSERLARVIRERRENIGLTRQELADATGIPYPTIAQIETAYRGVSPARLGVIARVLGLDPKELYDVLASAEDDVSGPPLPGRSRSRRPTAGRLSTEGVSYRNPRFATAAAAPSPMPMMAPGRAVDEDRAGAAATDRETDAVIDRVVDLLSGLPAEQRIEALGQVQNRLLARLLEQRLDESR